MYDFAETYEAEGGFLLLKKQLDIEIMETNMWVC